MSPIEAAVVRRKLSRIAENLEILRAHLGNPAPDRDSRDVIERRLQTCIEAAIDVNVHLLVAGGHPAPSSAFQSFLDVAAHLRALPETLARTLAPSTGLRNRLVHQYDEIDDAKVLAGAREALRHSPEYVRVIDDRLSRTAG